MREKFYSTQDQQVSLTRMVECARREYNLRKSVYPKWVQGGRMTAEQAASEIAAMESIYYVLFRLRELQEASEEMIHLSQLAREKNKPQQQTDLIL